MFYVTLFDFWNVHNWNFKMKIDSLSCTHLSKYSKDTFEEQLNVSGVSKLQIISSSKRMEQVPLT